MPPSNKEDRHDPVRTQALSYRTQLRLRMKAKHDEFRMAHFMYSLPEDIRKDIGWPDFEGERARAGAERP